MNVALLTAATQAGGAAAGPSYGPELVVNGDCSSGTGWTLPTGGTISGGKMTFAAVATDSSLTNTGVSQGDDLEQGATYRCEFTIDSITAGEVFLFLGGNEGTHRSTPGTYVQNIVATDPEGEGGWTCFTSGITSAVFDNFSVNKVL